MTAGYNGLMNYLTLHLKMNVKQHFYKELDPTGTEMFLLSASNETNTLDTALLVFSSSSSGNSVLRTTEFSFLLTCWTPDQFHVWTSL